MKRFGRVELVLLAGVVGGIAYACAAPEELTPEIIAEAERKYYTTPASTVPPTPSATGTTPTPPPTGTAPVVPPTAVPSATTVPPVAPVPSAAFAPDLGGAPPQAEEGAAAEDAAELEPSDAIPLDEWLNQ